MEAAAFGATIGVAGTALLSLILFRMGGNGKPHQNPPDPNGTRVGDMSVAWLSGELHRIEDAVNRLGDRIDSLGRRPT